MYDVATYVRAIMTPEQYMNRAIELSHQGMRTGKGGPFGAVLVKDGQVIAESCNEVLVCQDPTAHAEMIVIREACQKVGSFKLTDCELYASCEPCPMCLGAIYWAGIAKVYFAASREDAAKAGFNDSFIYEEIMKSGEDRTIPFEKIENSEARTAFDEWRGKSNRVEY